MADKHYRVVPHDGGWAYTFSGVFSEPYRTRAAALAAARRVVAEQHTPGETTTIEYQDEQGHWRRELAEGIDRPDVDVES